MCPLTLGVESVCIPVTFCVGVSQRSASLDTLSIHTWKESGSLVQVPPLALHFDLTNLILAAYET